MPNRRASTMIELIVTLGIIGVLSGLLLSGVQKVRGAAARLTCQSRMREVNLAAAQYHDTSGSLPGVNSFFIPGANSSFPPVDYELLGWLPRLLPYVEQGNAWAEALDDYRRHPFAHGTTHRNVSRVIRVYTCPADERTATAWTLPTIGWPIAYTSYLANAGTSGRRRDGVIYHGSRTQLLHVSDGTSTTVLFGERPPSPDMFYGWWYSGVGLGAVGLLDFTVNSREMKTRTRYPGYRKCPDGPYHFEARKLDDYCGVYHYWSLHGGGANFAFCDGSVRFLRYEADAILPALMTRAGGEVVPAE